MINNNLEHTKKTDIIVGILSWRIWVTLAFHDIRQRYRRSVLGPFWFTLNIIFTTLILGAIYSRIFKQNFNEYLPFLIVGLVVWQYISDTINDGCSSLIVSSHLIKQVRLPLSIHICRVVFRNLIILIHNLPVVLILLYIFGWRPSIILSLLPLGLFFLFLHGIWIGIVLGVMSARFRDIQPIIVNIMQLTFYLTPILWMPDMLSEYKWIYNFNPFYHIIELVRSIIIHNSISIFSLSYCVILLLLGFVFAQIIMIHERDKTTLWL
jgi:ABC-type polysaccharide/polyol phosphate export permease